MNKCRNCGKEFEGKFCPECGVQVKLVVFDDFEVGEIKEVAEERQSTAVQINSSIKPFKFNLISKITMRFLQLMSITFFLLCLTCYTLISKNSRDSLYKESIGKEGYIAISAVLGVAFLILLTVCIQMLLTKKPILDYPELAKRKSKFKRCLTALVFSVFLMYPLLIFIYVLIPDTGVLCVIILFSVYLVTIVSLLIVLLSFIKKIEKEYIIKNPDGTIVNNLTPLATASIEEFKNINVMREKRYNAKREVAGKVPKTAREVEKEFLFRKIVKVAVPLIAASLIFIIAIIAQPDIFDKDQIEKISVGDNLSYVTRILGDPYDKRETTDKNDNVLSGTYYYCSSSIAKDIGKINKKLEKFEDADDLDDLDEMIELSEKLANLEEKLSKIKCDYITVAFVGSKVTSISLQKSCYYGDNLNGKVTTITYVNADSKKYYKYGNSVTAEKGKEEITVNARLYFDDGSLLNKQIKVKLNPAQTGVQNLTWSDSFGTHKIEVVVK